MPALVLGGGITGLGVLRILARARIPSLLLAGADDLAFQSRHARPVPGTGGHDAARADLGTWLSHAPLERAVLIPCSDHWVSIVARLPDHFEGRFPASVPQPDALEAALDKSRFAALLARLRIAHPRTWPVATVTDLEALPGDAFTNAFLKPRDSQAFFARYGVKGFWVKNPDEAARRLGELKGAGLSVQLQEYVPGPPTSHVFIDGFADRTGTVRALLARRRLRMFPTDFGNSTSMVTIPLREAEGAVDAVCALVEALGFRGVFSVEFKQSAADGRWHALEMNARPWWYVDYAARAGIDVIRLLWLDAQELPVDDLGDYQIGRRCVYPYYDLFAVRAGGGGVGTWLASLPGADQPVFRLSDPGPSWREARAFLRRKFGRGQAR
jgi:predicted ATP-grasp superfamily ATP-dependent carboligase